MITSPVLFAYFSSTFGGDMLLFVLLLGFVWGCVVAAFIQYTWVGAFVANHLTWLIVAIGVGGDLLLALLLVDEAGRILWWQFVVLVALSSIALSARGVVELASYFRKQMDDAKNTPTE